MQVFERFADNTTMIRRKFPRGVVTRLKVSCKPGYQTLYNDVIAPHFKTGVWCGLTFRALYTPQELSMLDLPGLTFDSIRYFLVRRTLVDYLGYPTNGI